MGNGHLYTIVPHGLIDHGLMDHSSTWNSSAFWVDQNNGFKDQFQFGEAYIVLMEFGSVVFKCTILPLRSMTQLKMFKMIHIQPISIPLWSVRVCVPDKIHHIQIHYFLFYFVRLNENWEHCSKRINCGLDIRMLAVGTIHIFHWMLFENRKNFLMWLQASNALKIITIVVISSDVIGGLVNFKWAQLN